MRLSPSLLSGGFSLVRVALPAGTSIATAWRSPSGGCLALRRVGRAAPRSPLPVWGPGTPLPRRPAAAGRLLSRGPNVAPTGRPAGRRRRRSGRVLLRGGVGFVGRGVWQAWWRVGFLCLSHCSPGGGLVSRSDDVRQSDDVPQFAPQRPCVRRDLCHQVFG